MPRMGSPEGPAWRHRRAGLIRLMVVALLLPGCQGQPGRMLAGAVDVRNEQLTPAAPVAGPARVYVADFVLDARDVRTDSGIGGITDQVADSGGLLGRLSRRLSPTSLSGDPGEQTPRIVAAMAEDLTASLRDRGIPAERIAATAGSLPTDGWLLRGRFIDVDEGNRLQRAAIGFGLGATQMEIEVEVSDLAGGHPRQPFMTFGTVKEAGMKPGGFNPYAIAAKFRLEKKATEKDIQATAERIVEELLKQAAARRARDPSRSGGGRQSGPGG